MSKTTKNVLFITADQWRGECLSSLGHPIVKTPNLDALAAAGTLFCRHYAQATPCGPSRASLYTGLYLQNHRSVMNGTPLDDRHTNIAREARKAGYDPALFGYTDISADPRGRDSDDPELRTRVGLLPGMTPVVRIDNDYTVGPDAQRDVFFERARLGLTNIEDRRPVAQSNYVYKSVRERYGMTRSRESLLPFDLVFRGSLGDLSLGAFPRWRAPKRTPDAFLYRN